MKRILVKLSVTKRKEMDIKINAQMQRNINPFLNVIGLL